MSKQKHVVKDGEGWAVKSGGKTESSHGTQQRAIDAATRSAKSEKGEVVIHGRDGKIREKNSFGNDPYPPKG